MWGVMSCVLRCVKVAIIADRLIQDNHDEYTFLYNRFKNLMTSEQKEEKIYSSKLSAENSTALQSKFTVESGGYRDVLKDLAEFRFAIRLWQMFNENMTTEMSSRMNAMRMNTDTTQHNTTHTERRHLLTRIDALTRFAVVLYVAVVVVQRTHRRLPQRC